ncbi:MAG: carbon-nitrogen hydrolase family protein [Pseudomonadota bacterium]
MSITIAAAQTRVSQNISENGNTIRKMIHKAAERGARLIVFCEGALSGYSKAQIKSPADWQTFDWQKIDKEIKAIAAACGENRIFAAVGCARQVSDEKHPHNSLVVISDEGEIVGAYAKRFLSHSEVSDWYTPGNRPLVFAVDGFRFGCAICIEAVFPEVFMEYEQLGVDAVLFGSYEISRQFQIALQAHACLNCIWIAAAPPALESNNSSAFIVSPEGEFVTQPNSKVRNVLAVGKLDRKDPIYDVALNKARPWRAKARIGKIYKDKCNAPNDY